MARMSDVDDHLLVDSSQPQSTNTNININIIVILLPAQEMHCLGMIIWTGKGTQGKPEKTGTSGLSCGTGKVFQQWPALLMMI